MLGLSEYEYYTNSLYTNYCKLKGYEDKANKEESYFRNVAYLTYCANTEKNKRDSIEKFWPLSSDKKIVKPEFDFHSEAYKEMIRKIKKAHKIT